MISRNLAEFLGALVGDGCLSKFWSNYDKRWDYVVSFTGQWENDNKYYEQFIRQVSIKEFGLKGSLYHRKDDNTARFFIRSKRIVLFLKSLGMPLGIKNRIRIPKEIDSNKEIVRAFIRGIFNTDGTVYRRYGKKYTNHPKHYKNYAVIQFKMKNKNIIEFVRTNLEKLGFGVNRMTNQDGYWLVRITNQKDVSKFFKEIATNHNYHLNRFNLIKELN